MLRRIVSVKYISAFFFAVVLAGIFGLVSSETSYAAPYPGSGSGAYCTFAWNADQTQISATCTDDATNGSLDGAVYKQKSRGTFEFVDAPDTTKCTSKIVRSGDSATISGEYAVYNDSNPRSPRWECKKLTTTGVKISANETRSAVWGETFRDTTSKALIKACKKAHPKQAANCQAAIPNYVAACYTQAESTAPSGVSGGKAGFIQRMLNCLKGKLNAAGLGLSDSAIKGVLQDAYTAAGKDQAAVEDTDTADIASPTTCQIDGIGWIICPVMNFVAKLNDAAFKFLDNFLVVEPELLSQPASKVAWQTFRDFANAAFVVAFLMIVYSQLTGGGITNYGVKKMLPKLVIAAVLVNVSYYICQIAVDISNIAGASIYHLFQDIPIGDDGKTPSTMGSAWESLVGAVLVSGAFIGLIAVVLLAPTTLLAVGVAVMILIARKALLIMLVVISPLAFVAYLLPNTEQWFKKWWKLFSSLLVLYVVVAVIFGGSVLASKVLMQVAECNTTECSGDDNQMLAITALAVMGLPLFAVPSVLKGSLSAAGSLGQKLANLQDRANRRAGGGLKDRAGKELGALRNRATNSMLTSNSRGARAASFLTGARRRVRRDTRYDEAERLRKAGEETFAATDARSRVRQQRAISAEETAGKHKEILQNEAKLDHLNNNQALHTRAINSELDVHNAEETHKNEVKAEHHQANPGQYDALNQSRGELKNRELETERRFEGSNVGRDQALERQGIEGDLEIIRSEQQREFKQSGVGEAQAQQKRIVQKDIKLADSTADLVYEQSAAGRAQSQVEQAIDGELEIQRGENKNEYTGSTEGRAQAVRKDAVVTVGRTNEKRAEAEAAVVNRDIKLEEQLRSDELEAVKAEEGALVQELRTEEGAALNPQYGTIAGDLRAADIQKRTQTQRTTSASTKAAVEYAAAVKADAIIPGGTETLATVAGGIQGDAGISQAKAVAHQTVIDDWKKNVSAEETLLSNTKEQVMLGDTNPKTGEVMLGHPDILDQPDEKISAMASTIAKRQHMESHIKLWERTGQLRKEAKAEYDAATTDDERKAAQSKLDKVENMQQILMANKVKKPFGVGDHDTGAATVGEYDNDIYESTRERILTHLNDGALSSMDPDDMRLMFEMGRDGKLSPDHIKKIQDSYEAWEKNPNLKHLIKDKTRSLIEPIVYDAYPSSDTAHRFDLTGLSDA